MIPGYCYQMIQGVVLDENDFPRAGAYLELSKCDSNGNKIKLLAYTRADKCGRYQIPILIKPFSFYELVVYDAWI